MPTICRFDGIAIRMFVELGGKHDTAHFHVRYQGMSASFGRVPVELLAGRLPIRQLRSVERWARLHRSELLENWNRLQAELPPKKIAPLR